MSDVFGRTLSRPAFGVKPAEERLTVQVDI
jgi:hypothetical protein